MTAWGFDPSSVEAIATAIAAGGALAAVLYARAAARAAQALNAQQKEVNDRLVNIEAERAEREKETHRREQEAHERASRPNLRLYSRPRQTEERADGLHVWWHVSNDGGVPANEVILNVWRGDVLAARGGPTHIGRGSDDISVVLPSGSVITDSEEGYLLPGVRLEAYDEGTGARVEILGGAWMESLTG